MYRIIFNCDLLGDHKASTSSLCTTDSINIADLLAALRFVEECTSSITTAKELAPNLHHWDYTFLQEFDPEDIYCDEEKYKLDKNIHQIANAEDFKSLL
tara:strand:- start:551 stop:847 length:297 start_codon:yes stop_codon:yes gene_type:complete